MDVETFNKDKLRNKRYVNLFYKLELYIFLVKKTQRTLRALKRLVSNRVLDNKSYISVVSNTAVINMPREKT